jgi:gamma-glutamylcyclotransferase (GGCT)/AIG2-like uncharacterized protein YtfP
MTDHLPIQVFVYGTLKPGHWAYERFCAGISHRSEAAIVHGSLYHLPLGYPALTPGTQIIQGYLLSFADPGILQKLDDYENHDPEVIQIHYPEVAIEQVGYERSQIQVWTTAGKPLGEAWAYLMTPEKIKLLVGVWVENGNWQG